MQAQAGWEQKVKEEVTELKRTFYCDVSGIEVTLNAPEAVLLFTPNPQPVTWARRLWHL